MSNPIIGLESMPNVYFSTVNIEEDMLEATLTMKDFVSNPTWSMSDILRDQLKIKILVISFNDGDSAQQTVQQLNEGTLSIHDVPDFPVRITSAQEYIPSQTIQTDDINNFYYKFKITQADIDLSKSNVFIFGIAYVDLNLLNLDYASYKYLDGPMVSEIARENNKTPARGTLFRLDDGSIYAGPVHEHKGKYMEGSFHVTAPHENLTPELIESKVSDFMFDTGKEFVRSPQTAPLFQEFFHYEQELDTSLVVVDSVNLALNEFHTARELFNTNQEYFYKLMKDFYIPRFEMRKAPLKRRLEFLDIGTSDWVYDDDLESVLIKTAMVDGAFEERFEMRFFSRQFNVNPNNLVEATDNSFDINTQSTFDASEKVGYIKQLTSNEEFLYNLLVVDEEYYGDDAEDYKLRLELDVIDSFKVELENTKVEMLSIISDLQITYNSLFGKLDKQRIISFFASNGIVIGNNLEFINIESQSLFGQSIFSRLSSALRNILLAMISNDEVIEGVITSTVKNLYINSSSKENYNTVISFLNNLVNDFTKKYRLTQNANRPILTNSSISKVERKIQKVIEVNRTRQGNFSFFNKSDSQRIITASDMKERANQEYRKFFDRQISGKEISDISPNMDSDKAAQMADFESTKYIYFTPTNYRYGVEKSIDLSDSNISIFDEKSHDIISKYMFKRRTEPKKTRRSGKSKSRSKLGTAPKFGKKKLLSTIAVSRPFRLPEEPLDDKKYEDVRDYLGSTSIFLGLSFDTREKDLPLDDAPANTIQAVFSQENKINDFKKISLDNEESELLKLSNKIDLSTLPLQFRALVLSNYGLSRFSFPIEKESLMQNSRFSNVLDNVFNRVRIAQYLDGFEKDERGLRIINNPIYGTLSDEILDSGRTLAIKLTPFENGQLQIRRDDVIPSTNSFVFINGTAPPADVDDDMEVDAQISDRDQKEFSTTNIIKQNQKRQELNQFVDPVEQVQQSRTTVDPRRSIRPTRSGRAPTASRVTSEDRQTRTSPSLTRSSSPRGSSGGSSGGGY